MIVTDLTGIVVAAFLSALEAGLAYVNSHGATFPGGAQWFSQTVPEPPVIGVLGPAAIALFALTRRNK